MANIEKIPTEIGKYIGYIHNGGEVEPFISDIYLISLPVAGLHYYIDDDFLDNVKRDDQLKFYREKNNPRDEHAILVRYDGVKVGYIPRNSNKILSNLMDGGKEIYGIVSNVSDYGAYKTIWFKVFLRE
ncbi:hypothetical protein BGI41_07050 [Methanobrevibacter sp. 87.7]|uniref:HIRAN domain-containing protein n=1 Tax=Methanobrevibacter sp. 87.7 TaxID=387957 RepID=UPI000B4FFAAF|nr:HIRAN domain-containing protein [Methanobrevibacter sp. 87.7]OWT32559.1 hypothetical protein BGI41_07050 [Methanobrevibacter sp. 87.7]